MTTGEGSYDRINDYASVKISLARPHDIRSWSFGEVKKPETINYRTYRPEKDGLFCERIFGPEKDWECACGKYRGMKYKGMICDRCGVKVTHSRVRRKRMGHIELAAPVVHIWFFKAMPSRLGNLLDMKTTSLEKVIYFQDYVVIDPGATDLEKQQLLTEEEFRAARDQWGEGKFEADMGAEAVRKLLTALDLVQLSQSLREELVETNSKQKKKDLINRLKIVESIRDSDNRPEWMVLDVIPVIPPDLRPLVLLDSGNFATSDLNDLYRRIINRNNRLRKLVDLNAPEVIIRNEKRMLQQSVDALFDNNRCKRPVLGSSNRPLKSLTDMIKGKQGRFRENLLGKRVDYSARSVIVVGPALKLHQCGLPKKIALELYQPFIIRKLKELGHADTIKSAKKMLERKDEEVWDILESVIQNHPVLLNRAPTLHRMGIQAFEPVLVEGNAIHLHPLVCKGFNADFDGDQMAVHLPLSIEAQVEAHTLMMSTNNIFGPANGKPIMSPSQDIVMGCFYITLDLPNRKGDGMTFADLQEADLAYALGVIDLHARIKVRLPANRKVKSEDESAKPGAMIETTYGRIMYNLILPPGLDFYNVPLRSSELATVISDCYQRLGRKATIALLDDMNKIGFQQSTLSGLSFATDDLVTPESKSRHIADADKQVLKYKKLYDRGVITEQERYNQVLDTWTHARERITAEMMDAMKSDERAAGYVNPVYLMAHSGARGGIEQIRQLAGMRGLMAKPTGEIIETPIKANFREGLTVLEYFSSTHGARKGLADTALKTADSGYLTRKLADVAQNVVVTVQDCGTTQGVTKGVIYRGEKVEVRLAEAINGRVSRQNIVNPVTDEVIVRENELITPEIGRKIEELGLEKIQVRSGMTCEASLGVCRLCYGMDLSTGALVEEGMAVGIIAAQSIGEPGTQLTMRTFHIGGTVNTSVEESETRAKRGGIVKFIRIRSVRNEEGKEIVLSRNSEVAILDPKGRELEKYEVPTGAELMVQENQEVKPGAVVCQWDPHSIPILAEVSGKVRFEDVVEGETMRAGKGSGRQYPPFDQRSQRRIAPADRARGRRWEAPGRLLPAGTGTYRSARGCGGVGRVGAGQDAARSDRHHRHYGRSAARDRNLRSPQAQGPRRDRRSRRHGGNPRRETPRQTFHHRAQRNRHRTRTPGAARQTLLGPLGRHGPGRPSLGRRSAGAARHPARVRRGSRAAVPVARNPECLSQPARGYQRQTRRNHHRPHAPQSAGRKRRRLEFAARSGLGPFRFPQDQSGLGQVPQDHGEGRQRIRARHVGAQRGVGAGQLADPSPGWRSGQRHAAQTRDRQHPVAGHHQGVCAKFELHLCGQLPGDDQGPDGGGVGRKSRLSGGVEGKRHPRPSDSGRHRFPPIPGLRGPISPGSLAGDGSRGGDAPWKPASRCCRTLGRVPQRPWRRQCRPRPRRSTKISLRRRLTFRSMTFSVRTAMRTTFQFGRRCG